MWAFLHATAAWLNSCALQHMHTLQMYLDDLPVWGFIGKVERNERTKETHYFLFTHFHFELKYNKDNVIEVRMCHMWASIGCGSRGVWVCGSGGQAEVQDHMSSSIIRHALVSLSVQRSSYTK